MQGNTNTTGLEILEEIEKAVETRIGNFTIMPVPMRNFKRFTTLVAPLYEDLMAVYDNKGSGLEALIENHESTIIELITLSSSFTKDDYEKEKFYSDDFIKLILAVVELNMDFFVHSLLPKVKQQVMDMASRARSLKESAQTGETPSNS